MTAPGPGSSMSTSAELVDELRRRVQAALDAGRAARFANGETDGDDDLTASLANLAETLGPDDPVVVAVARALLAVPEVSARISAHEAAVVCHHFGISGGYPGSGFTTALVALMARCRWERRHDRARPGSSMSTPGLSPRSWWRWGPTPSSPTGRFRQRSRLPCARVVLARVGMLLCALAAAGPVVAGCAQAQKSSATPSPGALTTRELPQLSPPVDNPRDIRAYGDRPCEVFTLEQLIGFGFDLPPDSTDTFSDGHRTCVWIDSDYTGRLMAGPFADLDVLERTYAYRAALPIFEPLRIAGLPAVIHQPGPVATCHVTVGLATRQGLDVSFTDLRKPYEDPCGAARIAAEVAVGNLPPLQ